MRRLIAWSANCVVASVGVLVLATVTFMSPLLEIVIRVELHSYAKVVRSSKCSLQDKERLLDEIETLDGRMKSGAKITALRWAEFHDTVRPLVAALCADDVRLLERELQRIEAELATERTDQ